MDAKREVLIGARLREARLRQGLTIEDVATGSGVTKGFVSRLERDLVSPSVVTLVGLCQVLSLPVGELFVEPETDLVRAEDAPRIRLTGTGADERLLTARSQGRLQLIRSRIEEGGSGGGELYTLNAALEVVHVLSGRVQVDFVNMSHTLEAGDTLSFFGREPHTWRNVAVGESEILWVISPAPWAQSMDVAPGEQP